MASKKKEKPTFEVADTLPGDIFGVPETEPEIRFVDADGVKHELRQYHPPTSMITRCGKRLTAPFGQEVKGECRDCAGLLAEGRLS